MKPNQLILTLTVICSLTLSLFVYANNRFHEEYRMVVAQKIVEEAK